MKAILSVFFVALFVAAAALLILWPFWMLWCFVLPHIYPTGPIGLIQPGYWLFASIWFLMAFLQRALFSSATAKQR